MFSSSSLSLFALFIFSIIGRLIPHPPNCTPLLAVALFAGARASHPFIALAIPLASLCLTDSILGCHTTSFFVSLSLGLIVTWGAHRGTSTRSLLLSSLLFFGMTNFGVWWTTTLYPFTAEGLGLCYIAALPFFSSQLLGDLLYGWLIAYAFRCHSSASPLPLRPWRVS